MRIDRKTLALVFPVDRSDGSTVYVHCVPIGRQVFEAHYKLLARAFSSLVENRTFLPHIAALALRDAGKGLADETRMPRQAGGGADGGYAALMGEILRLTNIAMPGPAGWQALPYEIAMQQGAFDEEDAADVMSAAAFFTLGWHLTQRDARELWTQGTAQSLGGQTVSQNCTEYAQSLPTLTQAVSTGEKTTASSMPY